MKSCETCVKRKECETYAKYNGETLPVTLARTCSEYRDKETLKEFNRRIKTLKLTEEEKEELYTKFTESVENGFLCAYCQEKNHARGRGDEEKDWEFVFGNRGYRNWL